MGGPEVRVEQLRHLVSRANLPGVVIQILPIDMGVHAGMDGAFTILDFPNDDDPSVLYVEYPTGSLHAEKPEEVAEGKLVFDRLRSEALNPKDSVALVERVVNGLL